MVPVLPSEDLGKAKTEIIYFSPEPILMSFQACRMDLHWYRVDLGERAGKSCEINLPVDQNIPIIHRTRPLYLRRCHESEPEKCDGRLLVHTMSASRRPKFDCSMLSLETKHISLNRGGWHPTDRWWS